jgi:hypothetical protein
LFGLFSEEYTGVMGELFSFVYSRPFRLFLTIVEAIVIVAAILFVISSSVDIVSKVALFVCIAISAWEVGLTISLYVMTKDSIDQVINLMMRTTRRSSLRLYVFAVNMFVYLLAALYIMSHNSITSVIMLLLLPIFVLIWDKTNSLYMSFIITQIADKETRGNDSKKGPKNPLQK